MLEPGYYWVRDKKHKNRKPVITRLNEIGVLEFMETLFNGEPNNYEFISKIEPPDEPHQNQ